MATNLQFPEVSPRFGLDPKTSTEPGWNAEYEIAVRNWCNAAYEEAELDRKGDEEIQKIGTYIDYLEGRMWQGKRPSYKSKPVVPKVRDNYEELLGLLTDIKPIMAVKTSNPDTAFVEAAKIVNKGIRSWAMSSGFESRLAMNVAWGMLTSSYCKWQWNPVLAHGEGDLESKPLGPKDLMLLKPDSVDPIQSSVCVILDRPVDYQWVKRRFPTRGFLARPDADYSTYSTPTQAPPQVNSMLWDILSDGMKRKLGSENRAKTSAFPMCKYREFWFRDWSTNTSNVPVTMGKNSWSYVVQPGKPLYPRGRVIVQAGGAVMDDVASPYFHGKYPFTMLRLNAVPWKAMGLSEIKSWMGLNDILNQILAGIIDMIKRAVNPGFFAPRNAFTDDVWQGLDFSKPGERAAYSPSAAHEPKFAPAPVLPGYVMQAYSIIEKQLEQMSGKSGANQLMGKKQVPGQDAIEALSFMRTTPVRLKSRNIEGFLESGGNLQVSNMIQFYTQKRRMTLMGKAGSASADFDWDPGTMIPAGMPPEEYLRAFRYHIKPGSLLKSERQGQLAIAQALRKGRDIDRQTMYEIIGDDDLDYPLIEQRLKKEMQEMAAMGGGPKPAGGRK